MVIVRNVVSYMHMNEETQTHTNSEYTDAAAASKRLFGKENANALKAVGVGVAGTLLVGGLVGSNIEQQHREDERVASISQEYEQNQNLITEIQDRALANVDPANIVGIFDITPGSTINGKSLEILETLPGYEAGDESDKNFIDFTMLESGKAQGPYELDDTFVISQTEINGQETYIVQDGTGIQQNTLPSPNTH